jgi:hypothetical protein
MPVKILKLFAVVLLLLTFCLVILATAAYFWLWPMAQQYLASLNTILQQAYHNLEMALPALPAEVGSTGLDNLLAVLPILGQIGTAGLMQIQELAADGFTVEEAQQVIDILQNKLSPAQISQLLELLKTQ